MLKKRKVTLNTGFEKLIFDAMPMLKLKGINQPHGYLTKKGSLPSSFATRVLAGNVRNVSNRNMEKICNLLRCLPSDLYVYRGDPKTLPANHPFLTLVNDGSNEGAVLEKIQKMSKEELQRFLSDDGKE